jgi:hypothetical protein
LKIPRLPRLFQAGKGNNPGKLRSGSKNTKPFSNILEYSRSGQGNFWENYGRGTGTQYKFTEIPGELRAIAKSLFSPQKEIVFRARKSLITDIRAGARNSPFTFVSVYTTVSTKTLLIIIKLLLGEHFFYFFTRPA